MSFSTKAALHIALIYGVAAVCWILFTDQLLDPFFNQTPLGITPTWWQSIKGLFFVAVTSFLLFSLLHRQFSKLTRVIDRLQESEHRWQRLLGQTPEPVLILSRGQILYANRAGIEILGASRPNDVVGKSVDDFVLDETPIEPGFPKSIDTAPGTSGARPLEAGADGTARGEPRQYFVSNLQGERRCVEVHSSTITYDGMPCRLSVWRDVTRRQQYENQLVAAKNEAENASRMKSTILANLSHEIRTPLTAIIGFAELLHRDPEAPLEEGVELIHRSGMRLQETLESILTLAELESGEPAYRTEQTDIREVVRSAAEIFTGQARRRGLSFDVSVPDEPVCARVDSGALSQIVINLASNAVKFTDRGGVSVSVQGDGESAVVEVRDSGIGIHEEFLPLIFNEFVQGSQGLDREYEGSGLGLTVVRRLVELQSGTIDIESKPGNGTCVTVKLPAAD